MFFDGHLLQLIGILVAGQDSVFKEKLRTKSTIVLIDCIPDYFQSVVDDCYGNYSRMSLLAVEDLVRFCDFISWLICQAITRLTATAVVSSRFASLRKSSKLLPMFFAFIICSSFYLLLNQGLVLVLLEIS